MISKFHSYAHDFIRIALCRPRTKMAPVSANLSKTIRLARQGDALKAALINFSEFGQSACDQ